MIHPHTHLRLHTLLHSPRQLHLIPQHPPDLLSSYYVILNSKWRKEVSSLTVSDFWLYFNLKTTDHPINQSNRTTHTHPRHHLPSMIYTFSLSLKQQTQNTETSINKTLFHFSSNEAFYSSIALWFSLCLSRWKSWRCVALHRGKRVNQIQQPILRPSISSALVFHHRLFSFSIFFLSFNP